MDKLNIIVDKAGTIIADSKTRKAFLFNIKSAQDFIELSTILILSKIEEM